MFHLVTFNYPTRAVLLGTFVTLAEASQARMMSGDIVIDGATMRPVQDESWLFDYEAWDPKCYARRIMRGNPKVQVDWAL